MQTLSLQKLKQGVAPQGYQGIQHKSVSDFPINQIVCRIMDGANIIDCIPYMHMVPWLDRSSGYSEYDKTVQYYLTYGDLHPDVEIYILRRRHPDPRISLFCDTFYMYLDDTLGAKFEIWNQGGNTVDYLSPIIFKGYQKELKQFTALVNQSELIEKHIRSLENRVKTLEKAQRQKINAQTQDLSTLFKQQQQQPLIDLDSKHFRKKKSKDLNKQVINKARQLQQAFM
jgi:hypothetical protein